MPKFYQSKSWLRTQYVKMGKSVTEIAQSQGVTPKTIDRYLDKFGLKRNKRSWKRE